MEINVFLARIDHLIMEMGLWTWFSLVKMSDSIKELGPRTRISSSKLMVFLSILMVSLRKWDSEPNIWPYKSIR